MVIWALETIERVFKRMVPRRIPYFKKAHVFMALAIIYDKKRIGRARLSKYLGLTEAKTRELLEHLRNENLIEVDRRGIQLSEKGRVLLMSLQERLSHYVSVPKSSLTIGPVNFAIRIRGASSAIKYGLEQLYEALRVGALGATTLVFSQGELKIPGTGESVVQYDEEICKKLIETFNPEEGDVIVICSSNDKKTAELGVLSIALQILDKIFS